MAQGTRLMIYSSIYGESSFTLKYTTGYSTPGTGYGAVYPKTDGYLYYKNDAGTEYNLTDGTGSVTTEIDPVYSASQASNIDSGDITNLGNLSGTNTGDQDLSGLLLKTAISDSIAAYTSDTTYMSEYETKHYVDSTINTITTTSGLDSIRVLSTVPSTGNVYQDSVSGKVWVKSYTKSKWYQVAYADSTSTLVESLLTGWTLDGSTSPLLSVFGDNGMVNSGAVLNQTGVNGQAVNFDTNTDVLTLANVTSDIMPSRCCLRYVFVLKHRLFRQVQVIYLIYMMLELHIFLLD